MHDLRYLRILALDLVRPLHKVDQEAVGQVPRDMAVQRPDPRVVQCVLEHDVSVERHHHRVPADWVVRLQRLAVPEPVARREQLDVVAVQVHGVHVLDDEGVVHHDADGPVGAEVVDPACLAERLRRAASLRVAEDRVAVVALVEVPAELHHVLELGVHCESVLQLLVDCEEGEKLDFGVGILEWHGIEWLGNLQVVLQ